MLYLILGEVVLLVHMAFVLFAVLGGFLVLWRRRWAWAHVPTFLWAALTEFTGWICPLTPLENWLYWKGGRIGYGSGFVEHYILPVLYPAALTRGLQILLGILVLGFNLAIYGWLLHRASRRRPPIPH
jgi:hypothetical protein